MQAVQAVQAVQGEVCVAQRELLHHPLTFRCSERFLAPLYTHLLAQGQRPNPTPPSAPGSPPP